MGLIGILENIRAIPKKARGLFRIKFIWWKGLFWNIIKGRVYFAKRLKSGRALKQIEERGGGFGQNFHSSSSSRCQEQRRGRGRRRPGRRGKGGGAHGEWIPLLNFGGGPRREGSHGSGRRSALTGAAAALEVLAAAEAWGKERGRRWDSFPSLTMDWGCSGAC